MIKKTVLTIAVLMLTFMLGAFASATTTYEKVISYITHNASIIFNGEKYDNQNPIITYDGRIYVSVRDVATMTGENLNWNNTTKVLDIKSKKVISTTNTNGKDDTNNEQSSNKPLETDNSQKFDLTGMKKAETLNGVVYVDAYEFKVIDAREQSKKYAPNLEKEILYKIKLTIPTEFENAYFDSPFYYWTDDDTASKEFLPLYAINPISGKLGKNAGEKIYQMSIPIYTGNSIPSKYMLEVRNGEDKSQFFEFDIN